MSLARRPATRFTHKEIYAYLWVNRDAYNVIAYVQYELAEGIGMRRETMNYYYRDLTDVGLLEKLDKSRFRVTVHPKKVNWDELNPKLEELHKRHNKQYRQRTAQEYLEDIEGETDG